MAEPLATVKGMRYMVTNIARGQPGKTFGTYDKQARKVVAWHRTVKAAMKDVHKRNRPDG